MLACLTACSHVYSTGDHPDAGPKQDAAGLHDAGGVGDAANPDHDFVVNTTYAGDQFLTNDFEAVGLQLAATSTNQWTVGFRDTCTSCTIYGRRFDLNGNPVSVLLGSSNVQWPWSVSAATNSSIPALAASDTTTLALWDLPDGVACRPLDNAGNPSSWVRIGTDAADVAAVTALPDGNFVATWQAFMTSAIAVRAAIVGPDCATLAGPYTVSTTTGTSGAHRAQAAVNSTTVLYAWIVDGSVHVRTGLADGSLPGTDTILLAKQTTMEAAYVRVVPSGSGFALVVRWADPNGALKGHIDLYQVSATGTLVGSGTVAPSVGSDFASNKAFGVARAYDDLLMVVWHDCPAGPGSCDVFGALTYGGAAGSVFKVPYSSVGDQTNPSVIAINSFFVIVWNDASAVLPDTSGLAVRAQIMYVDRTLL